MTAANGLVVDRGRGAEREWRMARWCVEGASRTSTVPCLVVTVLLYCKVNWFCGRVEGVWQRDGMVEKLGHIAAGAAAAATGAAADALPAALHATEQQTCFCWSVKSATCKSVCLLFLTALGLHQTKCLENSFETPVVSAPCLHPGVCVSPHAARVGGQQGHQRGPGRGHAGGAPGDGAARTLAPGVGKGWGGAWGGVWGRCGQKCETATGPV